MKEHASPCLFPLMRAMASVESRVESKLADAGLSLPKLAALRQLIQASEPLPLGQLAERLACVRSNVTQLIDRLEADGFVNRSPDPDDRRSTLAAITASGRKAYEQGIRLKEEAECEVFGVLTPDESSQLSRLIAKLDQAHR